MTKKKLRQFGVERTVKCAHCKKEFITSGHGNVRNCPACNEMKKGEYRGRTYQNKLRKEIKQAEEMRKPWIVRAIKRLFK